MSGAAPGRSPDGALLDWWAGELAPGGPARRGESTCCRAGRARPGPTHWTGWPRGVARLVREGALTVAVLPGVVERLRREGRRIREYQVRPGGGVQCTVGPEDDVVLARLVADLRDVSRLDVVSRVDDGPEERLSDVPFDPAAGEVILAPPADALRARPAHVERFRLLAVGAAAASASSASTPSTTGPGPGGEGAAASRGRGESRAGTLAHSRIAAIRSAERPLFDR